MLQNHRFIILGVRVTMPIDVVFSAKFKKRAPYVLASLAYVIPAQLDSNASIQVHRAAEIRVIYRLR